MAAIKPKKQNEHDGNQQRGEAMTDELLHGAVGARAHVQEAWAPVVIDENTLADWAKLPEGSSSADNPGSNEPESHH